MCTKPKIKVSLRKLEEKDIANHASKYQYAIFSELIELTCIAGKGWKTDEPYDLVIEMDFNTNSIPLKEGKLPGVFFLPTFLSTNETECVSAISHFYSSDVGKAEALRRAWPIYVGVGIAAILFGVVILILYKKGFLSAQLWKRFK